MARGGHVFRSCEICKQTYIITQKTRSPSDGRHWIYLPLHFDVHRPGDFGWGTSRLHDEEATVCLLFCRNNHYLAANLVRKY